MASGSGRISIGVGVVIALVAVAALVALVGRGADSAPAAGAPLTGGAAVGGSAEEGAGLKAKGATGLGATGARLGVEHAQLPPGFAWALVRGSRGTWYELAYPEDWVLDPASDQYLMVTHVLDGETPGLVKLQVQRGQGLGQPDTDSLPTGTTLTPILVDGREALRFDLPVETLMEGGIGCEVAVGVGPGSGGSGDDPSQANELLIVFNVLGLDEAADCEPYLADFDRVLEQVRFVADTTSVGAWQEEALVPSPIANLRRIDLALPAGWSVETNPDQVIIQSDGNWPGGTVSITVEPLQSSSTFDAAADLPGGLGPGVRLVATNVADGMRTTEYVTADTRPVRWLVVAHDIPLGEAGYWENEQAIWRVMTESAFSHELTSAYP